MRILNYCLYAIYHSMIPGDVFNHGDTQVSSQFSSAFFRNENHHEKTYPSVLLRTSLHPHYYIDTHRERQRTLAVIDKYCTM
jgi:hypothetical protein